MASYLTKVRKPDLVILAEELNLTLHERATTKQIIKIITDDIDFNEETTKNLLTNIEAERLEEKEAERANREFELQRIQAQSLVNNNTVAAQTQSAIQLHRVNLIKPFEKDGDTSIYLNLFERQAARAEIDRDNYVSHLLTLLPLDIVNLIAREPDTLANNYAHIKKNFDEEIQLFSRTI